MASGAAGEGEKGITGTGAKCNNTLLEEKGNRRKSEGKEKEREGKESVNDMIVDMNMSHI